MKIQSLNENDFGTIDRVFRYAMGEQANLLRQKVQEGDLIGAYQFLGALQDTMATYEKLDKEMSKYRKEK